MAGARRNGNTEAPASAAERLALILADMLAEVLAKEATRPLGAPGPQGVGSAAKERLSRGGKT